MKAVTYHRVSTRDQRPELARDELDRAAAARALDVLERVEETGSGARNDRPGLARVLELVEGGRVAVVLAWKLDRLGRSMLDLLAVLERIRRAGGTVVVTSQGLELGPKQDAMSAFSMRILAAAAELERELIAERTRIGLDGARRRGRALGRTPRLTPQKAAQAAALHAEGWTYGAIGREMGVDSAVVRRAVLRENGPPKSGG